MSTPTALHIVGRDPELQRLGDRLHQLEAGVGGVIEIVGVAGIGKTTLLSHLAADARARQQTVLQGRATEFEQSLPFGLLATAFGADLLPLHQDAAPEATRHAAHLSVRERIAELATDGPLLIVLDDLHWADPASADLLAALIARPPEGHVLLALAHRPDQAGTPVAASLLRAFATGGAERLHLGPLPDWAADDLLPRSLPTQLRDQLRTLCGGNPFYLRAMAARPTTDFTEQAAEDPASALIPPVIAAALASELAPLPDEALELLRAAAISGEPFAFDVATAIAEQDLPTAAAALDQLLAADLVRPSDAPRTFAFRHPLVRHAVAAAAGPGWRLAAHARAAATLAASGAPPTALAHHLEQSALHGDLEAVARLTAAGDAAARRAPTSAARWYAAAWKLLPAPQRSEWPALGLHRALVVALLVTGRHDEARDAIEELQSTLGPEHPAAPLLVIGKSLVESLAGRHGNAHRALTEALERTPPDSPFAARLETELASLATITGRHDDVVAHSARALRVAAGSGDTGLAAEATGFAAIGALLQGDLATAQQHTDEAARLLEAVPAEQMPAVLRGTLVLARTAWMLGRIDVAGHAVQRGLDAAGDGSAPILAVQLLSSRAIVLVEQGRLAAATAAAAAALEEAELMHNADSVLWAKLAAATALEPVGDATAAIEAARVVVEHAERVHSVNLAASGGLVLARTLLACGQEVEVEAAVLSTHGGDELPRLPAVLRAQSYAVLAVAATRGGNHAEAASWRQRAHAAAANYPLPGTLVAVADADAEHALACGTADEALTAAERLVAIAEQSGTPLALIRARFQHVAALVVAGRSADAIAELRTAEAACAVTGASRLQAQAVRELRRLGRRVTRGGRAGVRDAAGAAALTPRQREVAQLAAQGHTNRAIAAELFLSEKTIETHLAAAMAKLGATSRQALPALLPQAESQGLG